MSNNSNYERDIRRALHEAIDSLPIEDAIDAIREKIRRHLPVNNYTVLIVMRDDDNPRVPPEWPVTQMTLTVKAVSPEHAEQIADDLLSFVHVGFQVPDALRVDAIYEQAT